MDPTGCATDAELAALADGTLTDDSAVRLLAHLDDCVRCSGRAAEHDGRTDDIVRGVRRAGSRPAAAGVGSAVGEYDLLGLLGAGGMGRVFLARHRRLDRLVALKLLASAAGRWPHARERFAREVKLTAGLKHPNLVVAHDAGEQDGVPYLVTEHIDGTDLEAVVRTRGPLPVAEAVGYVRQAAAGLAHLHAHGAVHRDVKPANLMRDAAGRVVVLDFGVARLAGADDLTGPNAVIGSDRYLAPEQRADSRSADLRVDVFGLGCTLHYLLTGRPPAADGPPLRAARPDVPAGLDAVCRRMLAADPADRPPSMEDVSRELATYARQRRRTPWLAGGVAAALAVGGLLWYTTRVPQPAAPKPPAVVSGFEEQFRRANPQFVGDPAIVRENGDIVELKITADRVTDLSPLRELRKLRVLDCSGSGQHKGRVADLSPIAGLPLVELTLNDLPVADLSPLAGMRLRTLGVRNANVSALDVLRGMPLEELDLTGTGVTDLSPLAGTPLEALDVYATKVESLAPLAGLRLRRLNCGATRVADLGPLRGVPLRSLVCDTTPVSDLGPIRDAPLERLRCDRTRVTDLSPLAGLPLAKLWCDFVPARDAAVLRGLTSLTEINGKPAAEFWAGVPRD